MRVTGDWVFAQEWLDTFVSAARERLRPHAESHPLDPGLPLAELLPHESWAPLIANALGVERRGGKAYLPGSRRCARRT